MLVYNSDCRINGGQSVSHFLLNVLLDNFNITNFSFQLRKIQGIIRIGALRLSFEQSCEWLTT